MRRSFFLLTIVLCGLAACQKEPDAGLLTTPSCKLDHIYYYTGGTVDDTTTFEYTGNRPSKVSNVDFYAQPEYSGNHITKINFYNTGSTAVAAFQELSYNADSTLSKVIFYLSDSSLPAPIPFIEYNFSYAAGVLTKLEMEVDTSGAGPVPIVEYTYESSNGNLISCYEHDLISNDKDTLHYLFDGNPNYFAKNPDLWLLDQVFSDFDGFLVPFALSVNNVVSVGNNAGNVQTVAYEINDKEDITAFSVDGQVWSRYFYKCQ